MSHSDTEEQLNTIIYFFNRTWKIIVPIVIIILISVAGWYYWQSYKTEQLAIASEKYESLLNKVDPADPKSIDELVAFANENDNIYGIFADLKAAQFYVETLKDYAGAESLLINARSYTNSELILAIINIRIAKLQYQLDKYQDSLATLNQIKSPKWSGAVNDIRGDIFIKLEKYQDAFNAYDAALASSVPEKLAEYIKMKRNNAEILRDIQNIEQEKAAQQSKAE